VDISELLGGNTFFQGGIALGLVGGALATLYKIPTMIWQQLNRQWMVSMTIRDKELIPWLSLWLSKTEYARTCRVIDATARHTSVGYESVLQPGIGVHTFKYNGTRFWLTHGLEDQGIAGKVSIMNIRTLGRDIWPIHDMIVEAVELANQEQVGKTVVFMNDQWGGWDKIRLLAKRSRGSMFLPRTVLDDVMDDVTNFFEGAKWYRERGLPYRRGYLLYGPAGNGKTTLIQVLASELSMPIYMLSLSDKDLTDHSLAKAIGRIPERSLLVLEDFEKVDLDNVEVTASGLLNAIDGSLASEGRLLVITANTLDAISEYFLRPGRIDRRWLIDFPTVETVTTCVNKFGLNGATDRAAFIQGAMADQWSMAQVQQELVRQAGKEGYVI